jgi:tetratricopeptide (TPR) repeat protein
LLKALPAWPAYNLEVPVDPWEEYRLQFRTYSQLLLKSYDRAFIDDYHGALREATKAIELLPDEGLGYAERAYYQRMLNNHVAADADFRTALKLFATTIDRYKPNRKPKKGEKISRPLDPAAAARLIATTHYQRGEAYFRFEQYPAALTDFSLACQGGEALACARMWVTKTMEKRGINWVPVANHQYYDKLRVDTTSVPGAVRLWLRREDAPASQAEEALTGASQQHLELRCNAKEYRILEGFSRITGDTVTFDEIYRKPVPGSAVSKLMYLYCQR